MLHVLLWQHGVLLLHEAKLLLLPLHVRMRAFKRFWASRFYVLHGSGATTCTSAPVAFKQQ